MYSLLLVIHSFVRWIVLMGLLYAVFRAYRGWFGLRSFNRLDNLVKNTITIIALIQLTLGLWLYFISPITNYFLSNYRLAVHQREIRFFGMEHSLMMVIAVGLIFVGSMKAAAKPTHSHKFKMMAVWYSVALAIIFLSIPWSFSPFTSRPLFRTFEVTQLPFIF